jgi:ferritin-like metal-binding protein YciE
MGEPSARDAKLIQYLNEAYGKEKELETALQAHIAMTTRASYKKRLQQHLRETKSHARQVERRIKQLGGRVAPIQTGPEAVTDAVGVAQGAVGKVTALAKGPLHAIRGTGEQEKLLKNAKTEYSEEAEEIATYSAIETLADTVGDRETAKVARGIRREEERMSSFLERLIPTLTKAVAQAEIPASERRTRPRRRRATRRGATAGSSRRRSSSRRTGRGSSRRSQPRRRAGSSGRAS